MLVDIHNHSLFGVDDGAKDIETSISMLRDAKKQGIGAVVFTPHYREGMFRYPLERINANFEALKREADYIGVKVYLGCEYHVNDDTIANFRSGRCHSLADGDYILSEYSHLSDENKIISNTREIIEAGYIPVLAHVERYNCIQDDPEICWDLLDMGALIQVNADSILGYEGNNLKQVCKKLLKKKCVSIVASDAHDIKHRPNNLAECYEYLKKKYDLDMADDLCIDNPRKIIRKKRLKIE